MCLKGTEGRARLCGRSSCGDLRGSSLRDEIYIMRKRACTDRDQRACTSARHSWNNDQVAQRTTVGGRIGMVMPYRSERCCHQEQQQHERDYYAPDSLLVRHSRWLKDQARIKDSVVQNTHSCGFRRRFLRSQSYWRGFELTSKGRRRSPPIGSGSPEWRPSVSR